MVRTKSSSNLTSVLVVVGYSFLVLCSTLAGVAYGMRIQAHLDHQQQTDDIVLAKSIEASYLRQIDVLQGVVETRIDGTTRHQLDQDLFQAMALGPFNHSGRSKLSIALFGPDDGDLSM